jgi:hypothetical protein
MAFLILKFTKNLTFGDIPHVNIIYKMVLEHIATGHKFYLNDGPCTAMNSLYATTLV